MRREWFPALGRGLSVLALGTDVFRELPSARAHELLDAWVDLGGNIIDTAREYGDSERHIGSWLRARGIGNGVVVVTKGAHPGEGWRSRLTSREIEADLLESCEALGLHTVDVFLLHRDDPALPVGPIVEAVAAQQRAGRARACGASNWTCARLEDAEAHASARGLTGFVCSSSQLSLAVPREPPWRDSVGVHSGEARRWYTERQLPLIAWSSQAGGFFAGVRSPFVERVYDDEDNRERFSRAEMLARAKGCTANQIAIAWVVAQPFPVVAVIGPRSVAELRSSVAAAEIDLTPEESRWLNLEEGAVAWPQSTTAR